MNNLILESSDGFMGDMAVIVLVVLPTFFFIINKKNKKQAIFFSFLYFYHLLFSIVFYYITLMGDGNDSSSYYLWSLQSDSWFATFGLTRHFVTFIVYPFTHFLGASYLFVNLFFGTLGFIGIYLATKTLVNKFGYKLSLITLLLLPSLHFWTSNIGKESLILFSLGLVINQLTRKKPKTTLFILGIIIAILVRPYAGVLLGFALGASYILYNKDISLRKKVMVGLFSIILSLIAMNIFTNQVGITSINDANEQISLRQENWTEGGSTINLKNYNFLEKIFTFSFRPLFFDAHSSLMLISSLENLILLVFSFFLFAKIIKSKSIKPHSGLIKFSAIYLATSIILYSTVTANLGTAVRKKSTIIPAFIIIYSHYFYGRRKRKLFTTRTLPHG